MPKALSDDRRLAIEDALRAAEEPKRNEIAERFGVSPSTVTRIAKAIGVEFDRANTKRATEARAADVISRTTSLADRLIDEAHAILDGMHRPYLVYNFGGKDNDYNEHVLDEPPIEVQRNMFTISAIAIDKALKVRQETKGTLGDESAFLSFLGLLVEGESDGVDYSAP